MKNAKIERMKELVPLLSRAAYSYEQEDREIMSNFEYDRLYDELLALEEETGVILAGSVTQKVGYEVVSSLPKVTHSKKMLSLDKTKEVSKLKSFLEAGDGMLSWKLDGLTVVVTLEDGQLVSAVSRGSGQIGENITPAFKAFKNVPLSIGYKGRLVIRGEALITYSDFNAINEKLPDADKYKNPRNLCSGSVRQLNSKITAERNVNFYAFTLVEGGPEFATKSEQLDWLKSCGFKTVDYKLVDSNNIEETVEYFSNAIPTNDFPSDGLVLTYNNIEFSRSLGETAKFPKDAIAFKWKDEEAETTLLDIEWSTSRTGLINPVAIFEPVELEGTTVERASVHNLSILEELQLGIGDTITIYKANMIIPAIGRNLTCSNNIVIPDVCPVCGSPTEIEQEKEAKTLYCVNPNCKAQRVRALSHYASRDAMNIDGLSEATLEKLLEKGFLDNFVSLYYLEQVSSEIVSMDGFGEKSYSNLMASIEKSRTVATPNFIYALGISQVGLGTSKLLCAHFKNDLDALMNASVSELTTIEGIGPISAQEIVNYFKLDANKELFNSLRKELNFIVEDFNKEVAATSISGKTFVITGDVHHFANRKELQTRIEELGGKVTGSVSKKTDYLINNDNTSQTSKNKKAIELNIPILTEEMFLDLISQ